MRARVKAGDESAASVRAGRRGSGRVAEVVGHVLALGYRPRDGALQAAHVSSAMAWFAALAVVVALYESPFVLAFVLAAVVLASARCGVVREVLVFTAFSAPLALVIAMVNPIASQQGLTVLVADIELPLLGTIDITREAVFYGLVLGLRALTIFAICALYMATVDPDQLLRLLRRFSVRSAITASLAVRLVPVLARDGARMAEARRCRPGPPPGVATIVKATFARSIDRASDAALALETRGYGLARPLRRDGAGRGVADLRLLVSALVVVASAVIGRVAGLAAFEDYPLTYVAASGRDLALSLALAAAVLAPFAWRPPARQEGVK